MHEMHRLEAAEPYGELKQIASDSRCDTRRRSRTSSGTTPTHSPTRRFPVEATVEVAEDAAEPEAWTRYVEGCEGPEAA